MLKGSSLMVIPILREVTLLISTLARTFTEPLPVS